VLGAFPKHGFLGEENANFAMGDQGYRWIVDPLDGTTNYVHGIPNYSVSIALERAGQLLVGVVLDPVTGEAYAAALGQGATVRGKPISVSTVDRLSQAIVAMSFPPGVRRGDREILEFLEVLENAQSMRRYGSSALNLCYVADGRFDGYWSTSTKIWDIAAGALIVSEAGGTITDRQGGKFALDPPHFVAAATPPLHAELLQVLGS
jgi:myo-inositol-1(or 4)-monophosphatase